AVSRRISSTTASVLMTSCLPREKLYVRSVETGAILAPRGSGTSLDIPFFSAASDGGKPEVRPMENRWPRPPCARGCTCRTLSRCSPRAPAPGRSHVVRDHRSHYTVAGIGGIRVTDEPQAADGGSVVAVRDRGRRFCGASRCGEHRARKL